MATVENQKIISLSSIKMEFVHLTSVDDADSFGSLLSNPLFGVSLGSDQFISPNGLHTDISGKTVTLNNAQLSDDEVFVLIFGF